ncbi:MAG: DUF998 domain-containing protein [Acidimicrobiales bacterium]
MARVPDDRQVEQSHLRARAVELSASSSSTASSLRARRLTWAGVVGPVAFGLAATVGAIFEDSYLGNDSYLPGGHGGYSHVYNFVSELAAPGSGVAALMTAGFLLLGASTLVFATSLRILWPAATALTLVIAGSGLTTLLAGTFPCDQGCPADGLRSTSQQLHDGASLATFVLWIAAALVAGWRFRRTRYGWASLALGTVQVVAAVALGTLADRHGDDPVGLVQRISLLSVGLWFVLTTIVVRTRSNQA